MAIYKQKGSNIYWFEFQFAGQRYRESAKTATKQVAIEAMRRFRRHIEESHNGITKRETPKLFPAAADEYLLAKQGSWTGSTMEMQQRSVGHLLPYFRKLLLVDITIVHVKKFIDAKLAEAITPRGVNMKLETLRAILRRNNSWERIRPDFKMLRVKDDKGRDLTVAEEERLLAECRASISRVLFPAVVLARCTGMRRDETRLLQWRQVDLETGLLTLEMSKTEAGENRPVRLNVSALGVMKDWASKFPHRTPEHYIFAAEKYTISKGGRATQRIQPRSNETNRRLAESFRVCSETRGHKGQISRSPPHCCYAHV
jgi:integrase